MQLEGWLIEADQQRQAEHLSRRVRTDLAHLLAERGLPADHAAGFSCTLAVSTTVAVVAGWC